MTEGNVVGGISRMGKVSLGIVAVVTVSGCALPRSNTTWLQDEIDGVASYRMRRRMPRPANAAEAAPAIEEEPLGAPKPRDLEVALLRFTAMHQRGWGRRSRRYDQWPPNMVGEWRILLSDLKTGLRTRAVARERRLLLQIRITLEAELERSAQRYGSAPPDVLRDTKRVFAKVREHLSKASEYEPAPVAEGADIVWPVTPQILTSPFGYRRDPILGGSSYRFHAGIDLGGRHGTSIVAAAGGEVIDAGWSGGHGRSIKVQHPGGLITIYSHLQRVLVREGDQVAQGQTIGLMGSSGRSTGPHLHFEVRRGNVPLDPLELLLSSRRAKKSADKTKRLALGRDR